MSDYITPPIAFETPAKPMLGDKPYSGLQDSEREAEFNQFRHDWALAIGPSPDVNKIDNVAAFKEQEARYKNNPLRPQIEAISKECKDIYDHSTDKAAGKAKADQWFNQRAKALATEHMHALDLGRKNPEVEAARKSAFQLLFRFPPDVMGAMQAFVMTMPPVAGFLRSIMSKFSGENLSYDDARKQMRQEEAYSGLAVKYGARSQEEINAFVEQKMREQTAVPSSQKNTNVELDSEFSADENKAQAAVQAAITAGDIVLKDNKYYATEDTVVRLDRTLPNLKKTGSSIRKSESAAAAP